MEQPPEEAGCPLPVVPVLPLVNALVGRRPKGERSFLSLAGGENCLVRRSLVYVLRKKRAGQNGGDPEDKKMSADSTPELQLKTRILDRRTP
jgi:hypothetical protein